MQRPIRRWRRCLASQIMLTEAAMYLLAARLALAIFSFRRLTGFLGRGARQPELTGEARARARGEVRAAIMTIWRRAPWQTTCFHRAIAAQSMLRRRRVSTTLYYGAATLDKRGLKTHVWLQDGDVGVMGHGIARRNRYHVLARYPASNSERDL